MTGPSATLSRPAAHALLHGIVLLWGATAILGRYLSIAAIPLVWYRLLLVVLVLAALVPLRGHALRVPRRVALRYAAVGAVIGLHWLCFYGAIKVAGVATAVLTLSTIACFTALIEPVVFRRRVDAAELVLGSTVVVGVSLLLQAEVEGDTLGLALGLGSAVLAAVFGVLNGKLASGDAPERMMLYELTAAFVVVSACFVFAPGQFVPPAEITRGDWIGLGVLAVLCTVVPQILVLLVLRTLSPFTVAVSTNLEPVYALILAALVFPDAEVLRGRFYAGAALLLGLVAVNAIRRRKGR